jgi:hypothetical protein
MPPRLWRYCGEGAVATVSCRTNDAPPLCQRSIASKGAVDLTVPPRIGDTAADGGIDAAAIAGVGAIAVEGCCSRQVPPVSRIAKGVSEEGAVAHTHGPALWMPP